ncbi:MAG: hydrogenase maturation nickel metallochaperone HypA [Rhodospirillales bacterium]|nr:hydrogenase maturation nickel metallochaperone HypA [Rhodospirillales bacterium]
MHELALCESIRSIIDEHAARGGFARVARVSLEIGQFACVEVDALRFGFDVAMRGGPAEAAELHIETVPASAWCMACARPVTIGQRYDPCPACGSHQIQVTGGDALRIKSMEVD